MVGATIVAPDGTIVGDGWHQQAGTPHAEIHAHRQRGDARARGATLSARSSRAAITAGPAPAPTRSSRPASHGWWRRSRIRTRRSRARGCALRASGVEVVCDVEGEASARLNAAFFMTMRQAPPLGDRQGRRQRGRTCRRGRRRPHAASRRSASLRRAQRLRAEVDAIAVGVETVLIDDPLLTVREVFRPRPLTRAILDRRLRTPSSARLLVDARRGAGRGG